MDVTYQIIGKTIKINYAGKTIFFDELCDLELAILNEEKFLYALKEAVKIYKGAKSNEFG